MPYSGKSSAGDLFKKPFFILDGAMGTMLQQAGLPAGRAPDLFNIDDPDAVYAVHKAYADAGADVLYANTFGANRCKLAGTGRSAGAVTAAGVEIARRAAKGTGVLVGIDAGPTGELPPPFGALSFEELAAVFREPMEAGRAAGADLAAVETMTDLNEARAAVIAAKEAGLPVFVTMTFEESGRTFTGCDIRCMALTMESLGADAVGINCSLGPDRLEGLVRELSAWTSRPLIVKANAGLPDAEGRYAMAPAVFAAHTAALVPYGVRAAGGCCGTTPETIAALKAALEPLALSGGGPAAAPAGGRGVNAVCNATRVVRIDRPYALGECVAGGDADMDAVIDRALDHMDGGADLLGVSTAGRPDEAALMRRCIDELQGVAYAPLCFETGDAAVLEAALRSYPGRALVRLPPGREEDLRPVADNYGALTV